MVIVAPAWWLARTWIEMIGGGIFAFWIYIYIHSYDVTNLGDASPPSASVFLMGSRHSTGLVISR